MPEERKLVTLLFTDVTGSTALGEALDPEDTRALMARYYGHARRVITEHGGTLEKFIGDAVMAVFGLPQAHGNDAERALAAALALRAAIAADSLLAERLVLRTGVNTGEVVATRDTSAGDFLVTGDAVNVAARLEQAANGGEILAGERTRAVAQVSFLFGEARAIIAKGKSQPVTVYPLVGPRPARELSRPPLVGRRRELAQLGLLRDAALEERHPQLVSIIAPAGMGKTRLLEEFLAKLDSAEGWQIATARCLPYGQTLTYWPLRGLLDELLGEQFSLERVAAIFAAEGHPTADAERLAELLLATLGVEAEEHAERESTFSAWRLFIEALGRQAPRMVVFEDLHWASESLLDLVEYIMRPRTQAALLIVATSRPELLDRRPLWGGGRSNFTALALSPLSDTQTRALLGKLARKTPTAARERLVERAGGNPFFAIELARGLAVRQAAPANVGADALPDTVHEAVLARLDLLSESEREVLQVAAVAGRTFRPPTLRAALPERDPAAITNALDGLLARDLVLPAEGLEDAYTFRHILFHDVAYGMLARAERARLHLVVARWLEEFASERLDEFAELLAYHYREAALLARQSAVPLNVEVDNAKAVYYLERAAELAGRVGAYTEVRRHLEHAIALAHETEHRRLYERLGDSAPLDQPAAEAYGAALERWRAEESADPLVGARLLRKIFTTHVRWSSDRNLSEAELQEMLEEARGLAEAADNEDERWRLRALGLSWAPNHRHVTAEDVAEGRRLGPQAAAYFEARGDWEAWSETLDYYGGLLRSAGAHEEAIAVGRRRLSAPQLSNLERGDALAMLAWAYFDHGDYASTIALAHQALDTHVGKIPQVYLQRVAGWSANAAHLIGQWSESDAFIDIVYDGMQLYTLEDSDVDGALLASLHIGLAREDRAVTDRAVAALQRFNGAAQRKVQRLVDAYRHDDVHPLLSSAYVADLGGDSYFQYFGLAFLNERGVQASAAQLELAARQAERRPINWFVRCLEIAQALTAGDDARLAAAVDKAEDHGLLPHAARIRITLAQRTGDRAHLDRARPVLEQLGDRQFLRRLEETQSALT
jgi:class 3 adenylate cyclase